MGQIIKKLARKLKQIWKKSDIVSPGKIFMPPSSYDY